MARPLTSRSFRWQDIDGLQRLMRQAPSRATTHAHIGHFYWGLRATPDEDLFDGMRAWHADKALVAAAWLDPPASSDFIVAPSHGASTLPEALDWLEQAHSARSSAPLSIVVQDGDSARESALGRRGYTRTDAGNLSFRRTLDSSPAPTPLPEGFSLRQVATAEDIERRASVETASFGVPVSAARWRQLAGRLPGYRPSLDLIAVAPDGGGASACTCWYDETTGRGEIEAVGTAPQFRRLGVCKAVIVEGLRRLHALGASEAVLYTNIGNVASSALYRSCSFEAVGEDHAWTRQL